MTSVSVVIPTRNRASRLEGAVRSALAQTVRDIEVIVVDDASDDETSSTLAMLAAEDERLRTLRLTERGGAARARNLGAARASGSWLAFLDDDCVWHPAKLELQLGSLGPGHGASYTRQATLDVDGRWVVEGRALPEGAQVEGLLRTNFVGAPSLLVERALFEEIGGFDEELPRLQDWDVALTLLGRTRFAFVPRVLVRSVLVPGGISTTPEPLKRAAELMLARHESHLSRRQLAALHYGLAKFLLVDGATDAAVRLFRRSTELDAASILNWMGLAAGLLGPGPARAVRSLRRRRSAAALPHAPPPATDPLAAEWSE